MAGNAIAVMKRGVARHVTRILYVIEPGEPRRRHFNHHWISAPLCLFTVISGSIKRLKNQSDRCSLTLNLVTLAASSSHYVAITCELFRGRLAAPYEVPWLCRRLSA